MNEDMSLIEKFMCSSEYDPADQSFFDYLVRVARYEPYAALLMVSEFKVLTTDSPTSALLW
jgi:hypothetical protein